mgnify:CR=1 FL=1
MTSEPARTSVVVIGAGQAGLAETLRRVSGPATGVLPEHRGRGLARWMKAEAIRQLEISEQERRLAQEETIHRLSLAAEYRDDETSRPRGFPPASTAPPPAPSRPRTACPVVFPAPRAPCVTGCRSSSGKLALADVVELNPEYDDDGATARCAARLLTTIAHSA